MAAATRPRYPSQSETTSIPEAAGAAGTPSPSRRRTAARWRSSAPTSRTVSSVITMRVRGQNTRASAAPGSKRSLLVEQVFLAGALGQHRGQLGGQLGGQVSRHDIGG
jgi:hypothetical protein